MALSDKFLTKKAVNSPALRNKFLDKLHTNP